MYTNPIRALCWLFGKLRGKIHVFIYIFRSGGSVKAKQTKTQCIHFFFGPDQKEPNYKCEHTLREKEFSTSSDLVDSSLVEGRRFFRPSSIFLVPGPNIEMAPAGGCKQDNQYRSSNNNHNKMMTMINKQTFFSGGRVSSSPSTLFSCRGGATLAFSVYIAPSSSSFSSSASPNRSTVFFGIFFSSDKKNQRYTFIPPKQE